VQPAPRLVVRFALRHRRYPARVTGDIELNLIDPKGLRFQAMALDYRTMLGPCLDTLRRMLTYLGATPEQIEDFSFSYRRWGQGTVRITLLPGRKNLLRLRE
jgi:hypothetical protein